MSYRVQLYLTHSATAFAATCCAWYGYSTPGFSPLVFIILSAAGLPCAIAAFSFARGLQQMESALTDATRESVPCRLLEFDQSARRLRTILQRQRTLVKNVDELMHRLGHASEVASTGLNGTESPSLTDALGQLSRSTAKKVGGIMTLGTDISKGADDANRGADEQIQSINSAIMQLKSFHRELTLSVVTRKRSMLQRKKQPTAPAEDWNSCRNLSAECIRYAATWSSAKRRLFRLDSSLNKSAASWR